MTSPRHLIKRLRTLTALVAGLVFIFCVLLPPVIGLIVRQQIISALATLDDTELAAFDIRELTADVAHAGWFSSAIRLNASAAVFSEDGQTESLRSGLLLINHGPVIWHLSDSLLALAELQLEPSAPAAELAQHFSASAIARLTPGLQVSIDAIAGINAAGGEHWAELKMTTPVPLMPGKPQIRVWLDLDSAALAAAGWDNHLAALLRNADTRTSNNRLLFYIGAQ